jgi:Dictyostelium (slime mold) repeat
MKSMMTIRPGQHWAVAALLLAGACTRDGVDLTEDPSGIQGLDPSEVSEVNSLQYFDSDKDRGKDKGKDDDKHGDRNHRDDRDDRDGRKKHEVTPIFECLEHRGGKLIARFGYKNTTTKQITIPVGPQNWFHPKPADRGQPTSFAVGTKTNVFTVELARNVLVWSLDGRIAIAHKKSRRCAMQPAPDAGSDVPVPPQCPTTCDDGNACTIDRCDTETGQCVRTNSPAGQACTDGNLCNGAEACNGQGVCAPGPTLNCDDINSCTSDSCTATGGCGHAPANENGACTVTGGGSGTCKAGVCTPVVANCNDNNPCTTDTPTPSGGCTNTATNEGGSCADANACNGAEVCRAGVCSSPGPLNCEDNNPCTIDSCNATSGCAHAPQAPGFICSPATGCGGASTCVGTVCTAGPGGGCDDSNPCTADSCGAGGVCAHAPLSGVACSDGNACNGNEMCQAGTCAEGTAVVCTASDQCHNVGTCNPATGACSNPPKADNSSCNDGNSCTDGDVCRTGSCAGTAKTCTASDQCHDAGTCNPATGACSNPVAAGKSCNDGNACTMNDICSATGVCAGSGTCSNPCDDCVRDNCPTDIAGCSELTGQDKLDCEAVVSCATTTGCAATGDGQSCYCGTAEIGPCLAPGGANGQCKAQIEVAGKTTDPQLLGERFTDPAFPLGRALNLFGCRAAFCPPPVCQ